MLGLGLFIENRNTRRKNITYTKHLSNRVYFCNQECNYLQCGQENNISLHLKHRR